MSGFNIDLGGAQDTSSVIQGVEDNSLSKLVGSAAEYGMEKYTDHLTKNVTDDLQGLQDTFIAGSSTKDKAELSTISNFKQRYEKLSQMAKSSGRGNEMMIRGEGMLKDAIKNHPKLADRFRQAAGKMGMDYTGTEFKIAQMEARKQAADAQASIDDLDADAVRLGASPGSLNTPEGQAIYQKRLAVRSKLTDMTATVQMARLMAEKQKLAQEPDAAYDALEREAKMSGFQETIDGNAAKRSERAKKAGQVDPAIISKAYYSGREALRSDVSINARSTLTAFMIQKHPQLAEQIQKDGYVTAQMFSMLTPDQKHQLEEVMNQSKEEAYSKYATQLLGENGLATREATDMRGVFDKMYNRHIQFGSTEAQVKRADQREKLRESMINEEVSKSPKALMNRLKKVFGESDK